MQANKAVNLARGDLPALLALYRHLHKSDAPSASQAQIEQVWSEVLANPRLQYFGGFFESTLACTCNLAVVPNLTRGGRPFGVIENVVTHPEYRGRGHGTALLQHALGHAWREGCYKVMLQTGRKDEGIFRFYERAGFSRTDKQAFVARPAV